MESKICVQCGQMKPVSAFDVSFENVNAKNGYNQKESRKSRCKTCYAFRERLKVKKKFLEMYGKICICCGQSDPRFLTLDHTQSDGSEHRKNLACHQIMAEAIKVYKPDVFQIQCYNCNCGRSANGGVCPHKGSSLEEYLDYVDKQLETGAYVKRANPTSFSTEYWKEKKEEQAKRLISNLSEDELQLLLSRIQKK